ncbi:diguanylate cyclase domain-containing protein [Mesorhizobium sp. ES1-4]|uniref:diguanylate cyclase domain-containing protein n=1 Tax=Mesorhizobium sp. ES1-4 TaxID=2876627 RepID=UPI0029621F9C|nr:diguanylate cyclase [Mesorhizobium sp. ES1-4]
MWISTAADQRTLGHTAGDAMLTHASKIIMADAGHADFVARIGGDEFVDHLRHGATTPSCIRCTPGLSAGLGGTARCAFAWPR